MNSPCQQAFLDLCKGAPVETFEPGEALMLKGEKGNFCYVILRGSANVEVAGVDGLAASLIRRGEGELIGELSLFQKTRSATVVAETACECARIPHAVLLQIMTTQPPLALALLAATMSKARGL
jgi:CRP/FNR family transcriptional regulator, cyclic AMP receptor protein